MPRKIARQYTAQYKSHKVDNVLGAHNAVPSDQRKGVAYRRSKANKVDKGRRVSDPSAVYRVQAIAHCHGLPVTWIGEALARDISAGKYHVIDECGVCYAFECPAQAKGYSEAMHLPLTVNDNYCPQ